jgi:hypothetical protein
MATLQVSVADAASIARLKLTSMSLPDSEMHESVHAIASCNVSPIVRIPANEGWMVKRALDAGAHGIIVPLLTSVEEAKKLVQAAKFPPYGKRGFGSPFSMGAFDMKGDLSGFDYMKNANDNLLTVVQIETKEALECVSAHGHDWGRLKAVLETLTLGSRSKRLQRSTVSTSSSSDLGIWATTSDTP